MSDELVQFRLITEDTTIYSNLGTGSASPDLQIIRLWAAAVGREARVAIISNAAPRSQEADGAQYKLIQEGMIVMDLKVHPNGVVRVEPKPGGSVALRLLALSPS